MQRNPANKKTTLALSGLRDNIEVFRQGCEVENRTDVQFFSRFLLKANPLHDSSEDEDELHSPYVLSQTTALT